MDFDEYEYLEKTVDEPDTRNGSSSKTKDHGSEKSEKDSRRKDREDDGEDAEDRIEEERRRSKKHKGDDENGRSRRDVDRDRDRERGREERSSRSERHRSSGRDGEREVDRERERDRRRSSRDGDGDHERERSSRGREKDDDRDKERERRDRDKDREKRDREKREREKERERETSRRSRSHSRHERERERELLRERERELESRESRRLKDKKEAVEPEADPERDQRTVFAYQMPLKATEWDVYEFFSKAGKVRDVRLIMDRNSRRSKGVGYIEFYDAMSVPMAIAMSGQLLLGQPVMVKPSEAEKNLVQSTAAASGAAGGVVGPYGAVDRKLYVGNLHFNMNELQLKQIFEAFGPVELVQLPTDPETGHCKVCST